MTAVQTSGGFRRGNGWIIPVVGALLLCGCTSRPPAAQPSATVREWALRGNRPMPLIPIEMMIAMTVARERCGGPDATLLARFHAVMEGWYRPWLERVGNTMGFHYRRAYGQRWWDVMQADQRAIRLAYENHPDPKRFCRAAATTARFATGTEGEELSSLFTAMYAEMAPSASTPAGSPAAAHRTPGR
jgi:hypothetical protein